MDDKIQRLKAVKQICLECTKCSLCEGDDRVTEPKVFGWGNANAKVVVVGQGPGYQETVHKKPFVGAAGKNFDRIVTEILEIPRKYLYITNTIKCYCPKNRAPRPYEVEFCRPILQEELDIIKPELIIALGNYALQYFTGHMGVASCHGQIEHSEKFGINVMPIYHPSPLNMNKKAILEATKEDFRTLKEHLESIDFYKYIQARNKVVAKESSHES